MVGIGYEFLVISSIGGPNMNKTRGQFTIQDLTLSPGTALEPLADKDTLAVTRRRRDQYQRLLISLVQRIMHCVAAHEILGEPGAVQFGPDNRNWGFSSIHVQFSRCFHLLTAYRQSTTRLHLCIKATLLDKNSLFINYNKVQELIQRKKSRGNVFTLRHYSPGCGCCDSAISSSMRASI